MYLNSKLKIKQSESGFKTFHTSIEVDCRATWPFFRLGKAAT